jgi:hypothetical protein
MLVRSLLIIFAGLGLGCTVTTNDTEATDPSGTSAGTSAGTTAGTPAESSGSGGGTQAEGTTNIEDPTSAGPTAGSSGEAESSSGGPGTADTGTADTGTPGVTFIDVFEQIILTKGCTDGYCHGGGAGGLTMTDEATAYANLVEVTATTGLCDNTLRVTPGSADESILWYRVRPAAMDAGMPCAPKMPQGSMGLTDTEAQLIHDWIAGGALE